MKLGFITNILVTNGMKTLLDLATFAKEHGFDDLEVGPTVPIDQQLSEEAIEKTGISISTFTYCRNFLSQDKEERENHRAELIRRIKLAGALGVEKVVSSTGIDKSIEEGVYDRADSIRKTPIRSLDSVVDFFGPVIDLCEREHVKLAFENCPLMGNIAISPYLWTKIFERLDSKNIGLAYDPSHLVWQSIDPYDPISQFKEKIIHFHAKDTIIDQAILKRTGILSNFDWWRYCIPGTGLLDWQRLIHELKKIGYNGTISIEHEDMQYENSLEKVEEGIIKAKNHIKKFI